MRRKCLGALMVLVILTAAGASLATSAAAPYRVRAWVTLPQLPDDQLGRYHLRVITDRLVTEIREPARWMTAGVKDAQRNLDVVRVQESPVVAVTLEGAQPERLAAAVDHVAHAGMEAVLGDQLLSAASAEATAREDYEAARVELDLGMSRAGTADAQMLVQRYERSVERIIDSDPVGSEAAVNSYRQAQKKVAGSSAILSGLHSDSATAAREWQRARAELQDARTLRALGAAPGAVHVAAVERVPLAQWVGRAAAIVVGVVISCAALMFALRPGRADQRPGGGRRGSRHRLLETAC